MPMRTTRLCILFLVQMSFIGLLASLIGCTKADRNVTTQHNGNFRTGAYLAETMLTPDRVSRQGMHILYWIAPAPPPGASPTPTPSPCATPDPGATPAGNPASCLQGGTLLTQLLYVRQVPFIGETANGLFAAASGTSVNAFNADNGNWEWSTNLSSIVDGGSCRVPRVLDATPVIDIDHLQMYAVFSTRD